MGSTPKREVASFFYKRDTKDIDATYQPELSTCVMMLDNIHTHVIVPDNNSPVEKTDGHSAHSIPTFPLPLPHPLPYRLPTAPH